MSNLEPVYVPPQAGLAPPGGPDGQSGPRLPPDNPRLWQHHSGLNCILTYVPLCVWTSSPLLPRTSHWTEGPLELQDDLTGDLKLITPTKTLLLRKVTVTGTGG